MALTRDFRETIQKRAEKDPEFVKALFIEALNLLLTGDVETFRILLRDLKVCTNTCEIESQKITIAELVEALEVTMDWGWGPQDSPLQIIEKTRNS